MKIEFTENFQKSFRDAFGMSRTAVRRTMEKPHGQKIIYKPGLTLGLFLRTEPRDKVKDYLFVLAHEEHGRWMPGSAYWIPLDLMDSPHGTDPIPLLQKFAERFGIPIRIGERESKFIYQEVIPLGTDTAEPVKIILDDVPQGHLYTPSLHLRPEQRDEGLVMNCTLAYCVHRTEYQTWLASGMIEGDPLDPAPGGGDGPDR